MAQGSSARRGDVVVLVGTRKDGFILSSDATRRSWSVSGPHWPGGDIFHMDGPRFDADQGLTLGRAWHIEPGRENEPGVVYAGVVG